MTITQVTHSVISANSVLETKMANASVGTRQIVALSITQDKLSANANVALVQNNVNAIANGTTPFTGDVTFQSNVTVHKNVVVIGNLTVSGNNFIANVANLVVRDTSIIINHQGNAALAEGSGLSIESDGALVANLFYAINSRNGLRLAKNTPYGALVAANDIATFGDFQANDYSTLITTAANDYNSYLTLTSNDGTTLLSARANDYNTYIAATANTTALDLKPRLNTNVYSTSFNSNVFFIGGQTPTTTSNIDVFLDGLLQPATEWIFTSANNTIQLTDVTSSLPQGIRVSTIVFTGA